MKATFAEWLETVDLAVWQLVGMSIDDLPDVPFADWHEDGVTPKRAAARAVRAARDED